MGLITLDRFRTLLMTNPVVQGKTNIDKDLLTDFVNLGYYEVVGALEFDALIKCASLNTVADVGAYALPVRFLGISSLTDRTGGYKILRTSLRNLERYSHTERSYPKYWARKGDGIVLWPVPDAAYQLFAYFVAEPPRLESPADVTVLPATWDNSILMLAQGYLLQAFNEFEGSDRIRATAFANMGSRLKDVDYAEPMDAAIRVARSERDLYKIQEYS